MPVVTAGKITFTKKARFFCSPKGTEEESLTHLGLLGADLPFTPEKTYREKMDRFPEVVVAYAILQQRAILQPVLREWKTDVLLPAMGLYEDDITVEAGGDVVVEDEGRTFNDQDLIILKNPIKLGTSPTVKEGATTYVAGTDYFVVERDSEGRTLIARIDGGDIAANASVTVDYTYNLPGRRIYPIGRVAEPREWTIKLVEDFTNGGKAELVIWRARVGIQGDLQFNSAEQGGDLPLMVEALYDNDVGELASLRDYDAEAA